MLTAKAIWSKHPQQELSQEEVTFQKGLLRCFHLPAEEGKKRKTKVWRFKCPYTAREFNATEYWFNFFSKSSQKAIQNFIADPKNRFSTWSKVRPCDIIRWSFTPGTRYEVPQPVKTSGLIPINLMAEDLPDYYKDPNWIPTIRLDHKWRTPDCFKNPRQMMKTKK